MKPTQIKSLCGQNEIAELASDHLPAQNVHCPALLSDRDVPFPRRGQSGQIPQFVFQLHNHLDGRNSVHVIAVLLFTPIFRCSSCSVSPPERVYSRTRGTYIAPLPPGPTSRSPSHATGGWPSLLPSSPRLWGNFLYAHRASRHTDDSLHIPFSRYSP